MKKLFKAFYLMRISQLKDSIELTKAIHNTTEDKLVDNISYIRNKAALEYYQVMLSVVNY